MSITITNEQVVAVGNLLIDRRRHRVTLAGEPVTLTPVEFKLLLELARDPGRVCLKEQLLRDALGWANAKGATTRTLDSHACRLRKKLGGGYVHNIWGVGYCLRVPL